MQTFLHRPPLMLQVLLHQRSFFISVSRVATKYVCSNFNIFTQEKFNIRTQLLTIISPHKPTLTFSPAFITSRRISITSNDLLQSNTLQFECITSFSRLIHLNFSLIIGRTNVNNNKLQRVSYFKGMLMIFILGREEKHLTALRQLT